MADLVSAILPPLRSARLAARRVPNPEPISLGTNSLVLPLGFPRPPDDLALLCCPRSGLPPDFEESTDRRMEWSPQQLSNQWDLQWLCLRCGRSMATLNRKTRTNPKPAQSVSLLMVLDILEGQRRRSPT